MMNLRAFQDNNGNLLKPERLRTSARSHVRYAASPWIEANSGAKRIGEAWQLGWRIPARCAFGNRDGMKSIRACAYSYGLDLKTLTWTRGAPFPISDLATRLKCPSCRSRRVALIFHMPREPQTQRAKRSV